MMIPRDVFVAYNQLERKLETELKVAAAVGDLLRLPKLRDLRRRCFPTKEEVIEELQAFFNTAEVMR